MAAQHQGVLRRRHVQTYDIFELLSEWITQDLEGLDQVRLQPTHAPMARNTRLTHAKFVVSKIGLGLSNTFNHEWLTTLAPCRSLARCMFADADPLGLHPFRCRLLDEMHFQPRLQAIKIDVHQTVAAEIQLLAFRCLNEAVPFLIE